MTQRVLTLRELNRATLARQLLLPAERRPRPAGAGAKSRGTSPPGASPPGEAPPGDAPGDAPPLPPRQAAVLAALEQVAGLQAQASRAAYVGLWARVPGFERDDLTELLQARLVVKATLMRGTIHLVTAADYLRLRPAVQPLLTRLARNFIRNAGAERESRGAEGPDRGLLRAAAQHDRAARAAARASSRRRRAAARLRAARGAGAAARAQSGRRLGLSGAAAARRCRELAGPAGAGAGRPGRAHPALSAGLRPGLSGRRAGLVGTQRSARRGRGAGAAARRLPH